MSKGGLRPGSGARKTHRTAEEARRVVPIPGPPEEFSEHEKRVWVQLAAQTDALQIFTETDLVAFANWTRAQTLFERAVSGEAVDVDREGAPKAASLAAIATLARTASMFASQFRANPLARGAVAAPVQPEILENDPDDIRPLRVVRPGPPSAS